MSYSLGAVIGSDSRLTDVLWEGPTYKSGLTAGSQIIAVAGNRCLVNGHCACDSVDSLFLSGSADPRLNRPANSVPFVD